LPVTSPREPRYSSSQAGLFTTLKEQLGLPLEEAKTTVAVVVIDAAERPGEN
jgi:uncharacterized protein (TIGR03435 family)